MPLPDLMVEGISAQTEATLRRMTNECSASVGRDSRKTLLLESWAVAAERRRDLPFHCRSFLVHPGTTLPRLTYS